MFLPTILTFLIVVVLLALGGGILALIAYGLGWLIHLITKFDLFQSTLLGLAGMFAAGILAERIFSAILSSTKNTVAGDDTFEDEFDDEFDDDEDLFGEEEDEPPVIHPSIPLWRQPLKPVDFSKAKPNDRCPCGSGRKFKNCHGAKQKTS